MGRPGSDETSTPEVIWECFIPFKPVPCPRPRLSRNRAFMPKAYTDSKDTLVRFLKGAYSGDTIGYAVQVQVVSWLRRPASAKKRAYPTVRPDLDNYVKSILDGMTQAGVLKDDSLVVDLVCAKRYADDGRIGTDIAIISL